MAPYQDVDLHHDAGQKHTSHLHPFVPIAAIGFALWFVLAVWEFGRNGQADYLLAIVSGFFLMTLAIPYALWRQWRRIRRDGGSLEQSLKQESFRDWMSENFETWQDRVKAKNAAIEIILPLGAAAIGMTAFGVVLHIVAAHVGG
jgi:hypothetical protein